MNAIAEFNPQEFKIVSLRECAPVNRSAGDNALRCYEYWLANVMTGQWFNPDTECLVAILMDTRLKIMGHTVVSIGLLDTILFHPREAFRAAVIGAASKIVLLHNHPSGDPTPSAGDIHATGIAVEAGKIVGIEVLDHVIVGGGRYFSLRDEGFLNSGESGKKRKAMKALREARVEFKRAKNQPDFAGVFSSLNKAKTARQSTAALGKLALTCGPDCPCRTQGETKWHGR